MRLGWNMPKDIPYFNFNCGTRSRCGSSACFSHFITIPVLEKIVLNDVRDKAQKIVADEREFRRKFLEHTARLADKNQADVKRELKRTERRVAELDKLISAAFEEKVAGKIPENVCLQLIDKYTAEQTELKERISYLTQGLEEKQRAATDMNELEKQLTDIEDKIELEKYNEQKILTKEKVMAYLTNAILKKPKTLIHTLIQKIIVYEDKIEIFYNYTDETNPGDDSPRDSYLLSGSDSSVMVEINSFCRNPDGAPSARRRALPSHEQRAIASPPLFFLPFRRAWFSSASATQKGTLKWVPLRGGQKPYKFEPSFPFFRKVVLRCR